MFQSAHAVTVAEPTNEASGKNVFFQPKSGALKTSFFRPSLETIPPLTSKSLVEKRLQRKGNMEQEAPEVSPVVEAALQSPGTAMDEETTAFMQQRIGYDFSNVKIHNDSLAHRSSENINALAYTHRDHVVFAQGQYQPHTESGKRLIAHELTHVVQQNAQQLKKKVQRTINYIRELPPTESQPYLDSFDRSLQTLESTAQRPQVPLPAEVQQAIQLLRRFRTQGRITCWETSGGLVYASYDNATQQIRLHIHFAQATTTTTILHEAIHALHAAGNPEIARVYGQVLSQGGTTDRNLGILMAKWKVWTEYWAYRGTTEYHNSLQTDPQFRENAHRTAMSQPDVRGSVQRVRDLKGLDFDPSTWTPPAHWVAPAAYRQRRR